MDLSGQIVIAILTRAPASGGKTRLFEELGCSVDPELLRALFLDTLDAAAVPHTVRVVFLTPAAAHDEMRALVPPDVGLYAQREGDLGERMRGVFDDLLQAGAAGVLLIGSDLPLLPAGVLVTARDRLTSRPSALVLGPAGDGGYYLLGATRTPTHVLDVGGWGAPDILERTMQRARENGIDIVLLPTVRDVDTPDDLRAMIDTTSGGRRTRAWARARFEVPRG